MTTMKKIKTIFWVLGTTPKKRRMKLRRKLSWTTERKILAKSLCSTSSNSGVISQMEGRSVVWISIK